MIKPGHYLLEIIANEYSEGDVIGLFVGVSELVKVQLRSADLERGLIFGSAWPSDKPIAFRASCVQGFVELDTFEDEE
jgi:hypothetical protein